MHKDGPISVSTVVLDGHSFDRGLDLLAKAGVRSVEPAFIEGYMPFDEETFREKTGRKLAAMLGAAGLSVTAVSAHIDLGREDSLEKLRRRLDFAACMGARVLISNATTEDGAEAFKRLVTAISPDLAANGMVLALENPGHGSGALLANGARGAVVIAALADPHIRMNYDIGNAASYGACTGTQGEDLEAALAVAAHLHLKDLRDSGGDWHFCPVGQGDIGYGTTIPLDRIPADMPIALEHPIRLWRPRHGDPQRRKEVPTETAVIQAIRTAVDFVSAARRAKT